MLAVENIQQYVQKLPQPLQVQVLDFVAYLLQQMERETTFADESVWAVFSLASAMRGMEDEETPLYTLSDLKVAFT